MNKKYKIYLIVFLVSYILSYGICRWRKILVYRESYSIYIKEGCIVRYVGPGQDLRSNFVGNFKNTIARPCYYIYYPLAKTESYLRN